MFGFLKFQFVKCPTNLLVQSTCYGWKNGCGRLLLSSTTRRFYGVLVLKVDFCLLAPRSLLLVPTVRVLTCRAVYWTKRGSSPREFLLSLKRWMQEHMTFCSSPFYLGFDRLFAVLLYKNNGGIILYYNVITKAHLIAVYGAPARNRRRLFISSKLLKPAKKSLREWLA